MKGVLMLYLDIAKVKKEEKRYVREFLHWLILCQDQELLQQLQATFPDYIVNVVPLSSLMVTADEIWRQSAGIASWGLPQILHESGIEAACFLRFGKDESDGLAGSWSIYRFKNPSSRPDLLNQIRVQECGSEVSVIYRDIRCIVAWMDFKGEKPVAGKLIGNIVDHMSYLQIVPADCVDSNS